MFRATRRSATLRAAMAVLAIALFPAQLLATWSVIAVDASTGRVVIASATCVPQARLEAFPAAGLMDIQAIVVPGVGVAAAQAGVDRSRANQTLIYEQMRQGTDPSDILTMLGEDPDFQRRQFAIVDLQGRMAGFSGSGSQPASLSVQGRLPDQEIYFSVQGNILASNEVVYRAVHRFMSAEGSLTDRVMAAMAGADEAGGDVRCTCETEPLPEVDCDGRNAYVAYILAADPTDLPGESFNDGSYEMYLSVTDEDIQPHENANPVLTLQQRYGAWRAGGGGS